MKIPYLVLLMASASIATVHAETTPPPVLDHSAPATAPTPAVPATPAPTPAVPVTPLAAPTLTSPAPAVAAPTPAPDSAAAPAKESKATKKKASVKKKSAKVTKAAKAKPLKTPKSVGHAKKHPKIKAAAIVDTAEMTVASSNSEDKVYKTAMAFFKKRSYAQASSEFQKILAHNPKGKYASNAQFWLGEVALRKGHKQAAMLAFDKVIRTYPKSGKAPDSMYKLGLLQLALGKTAKAVEYFDYVIQYYPTSNAATLAKTKKAKAGLL